MNLMGIYESIAAQGTATWAALACIPAGVLLLSGAARLMSRRLSQWIANAGILAGLLAVFVELIAIGYVLSEHGAGPLLEADLVMLAVPWWLAVASFAVEHLLHPGQQEGIRRPVRSFAFLMIVVLVLGFVLSVTQIHYVIFSSVLGFLVTLAVVIALLYGAFRAVV